jgi:phospholipid N-methyltransferase
MHTLRFATVAVRDYNKVGALTVSTKYVVRGVARQIDEDHRFIVEYGAGDGILSKSLLKRLPDDARVTAIELNDHLFDELGRIRDPRFHAIKGDAIALSRRPETFRLPRIDAVVSSIPLTFVDPRRREELIRNTYDALVRGGVFVVYQYTPFILRLLGKYFRKLTTDFEPRNIPPYFIMRAEK